ncbi:MAG: type VII toxin-antitoxin system HepT family RNase toxin [Dermatophilaceae bacterium]
MTPPPFDPHVVQTRLVLIGQLLGDLEQAGEVSAAALGDDRMLRHAIERVLSQIVELAVAVNSHVSATQLAQAPRDYRSSFDLMCAAGVIEHDLAKRLKPSVGLRNVLTHEYVEVDLTIVARAVGTARIDYGDYVRAVSSWLNQR